MIDTQQSSATETRHPLPLARHIAEQLVERFAPFCERIEIAGSIRRERPTVKDIELVAIPKLKQSDLFGQHFSNMLTVELSRLLVNDSIMPSSPPRWGDKYRAFVFETPKTRTHYKVDLFMCTLDNWGPTFTIRTGPADFSRKLVTRQPAGYMPNNMRQHNGYLWRGNEQLSMPAERTYFDALGLEFTPPEQR